MKDIYIIPKKRDKKAKACYLIIDWMLRKNRKLIRDKTQEAIMDLMLYGKGAEEIKWKHN